MKKSLIAMAVLAASGAAMAQSSVTLYGVADLWVGPVKVETAGVSTTTTHMVSGGVSTPRWGMRGSEDLGGGLKANFNLEQGVTLDTGAAANFARQAWVGFSGGFGEVRLGLTPTPFDNLQGASDAAFDSDLAPANAPTGLAGTGVFRTSNDYTGKPGNSIYYKSPTMAGLSAEASYVLAEDANGVPAGATSITALGLSYAAGPVAAQFAYQKEDKNNTGNDLTYTRLGASYNFGAATAKFMYGKVGKTANTANGSTSEWQLGVDVPVSAALTLSGSYAKSTDNAASAAAGVGEVQRSGFGLAAAYGLSKRTTVYGGMKKVKLDNGSAADTNVTAYGVGIRHAF